MVDRLIFWDIDGTLMHCGSDGRKALNRTFYELYGIIDAFRMADVGSSMDFMLISGIMANFGIDQEDLFSIMKHYREVLIEILEENNTKRVLPGVVSVLDAIDKHPHSINALLTSNLRIGAEAKLNSVGLYSYFNLGGFGDDPGEKWDAANRCISYAEKQYNTFFPREQIYLIGDSTYDIYSAQKMGIKSIAVATGWVNHETLISCNPDYFFSDLSNTNQVLEALNI